MTTEVNRRDFLKKGALASMAGCALLITSRMNPLFANSLQPDEAVKPDPKKLNYCGYQCPSDCKFLKATQENNTELKKKPMKSGKSRKNIMLTLIPTRYTAGVVKHPISQKVLL